MAPKSQEMSAEIADGLLMTCLHPERFDVLEPHLRAGFAKAGGKKSLATFDVAPAVACVVGTDLDACRLPLKMSLALYIGGMGAKDKNFYNAYIRRVGFEAEAERIQNLFLGGKRDEAIAAVPDELVDALHLVGTPERIRDRFAAWKSLPIGTLMVGTQQMEAVRLLAELAQS
jgi:alkanesulfonate monooxygenase SsuD/methylene tetrahydromethanopterin reductase-like flavin-dependent oxidoreductase (luciferase family)